jgi:hypothetical protein
MDDNYSPYCPTCDACGEDGCCNHRQCFRALVRTNPNCHYGERYILEAMYNERCLNLCMELIDGLSNGELTSADLIQQYDTGLDKIWNEVFNQK